MSSAPLASSRSIQLVPRDANSFFAAGETSKLISLVVVVKMTPLKKSSRKTSSVDR